jgi:hypothetical protein
MGSQTITTPKRATRATAQTKAGRATRRNGNAASNGDAQPTPARRKPLREMTLEELSLRAYKMTYEQLHGSKKKKK